jgi:hypothetical protein
VEALSSVVRMELDSGLAAFGFQKREYVRNHPVVYASNHLVRIIQPLERILQFKHLRFGGSEVPNQFPSRVVRLSHFYADMHAAYYTSVQEDRESGNPGILELASTICKAGRSLARESIRKL